MVQKTGECREGVSREREQDEVWVLGRDAHVEGHLIRGGSLREGASRRTLEVKDPQKDCGGGGGVLRDPCHRAVPVAGWSCLLKAHVVNPLCAGTLPGVSLAPSPAAWPSWEQEPHSVGTDGESQNQVLLGTQEAGGGGGGSCRWDGVSSVASGWGRP